MEMSYTLEEALVFEQLSPAGVTFLEAVKL